MPEKTPKKESSSNGGRALQVVLTLWALAIFYHYYESQQIFKLAGQVIGVYP